MAMRVRDGAAGLPLLNHRQFYRRAEACRLRSIDSWGRGTEPAHAPSKFRQPLLPSAAPWGCATNAAWEATAQRAPTGCAGEGPAAACQAARGGAPRSATAWRPCRP